MRLELVTLPGLVGREAAGEGRENNDEGQRLAFSAATAARLSPRGE